MGIHSHAFPIARQRRRQDHLLNVLCGFIHPDHGEVRFNGSAQRRIRTHALAALGVARTLQGVGLFGGVTALDGVSVTAPPATITAVLGANGAGKTTLLRAISGLVRPRAGAITLDSTDLTGKGPSSWYGRASPTYEDEIPASSVVAKESYVDTNVDIAPQVAALRAAGAQVVISFSIPAFTALLKLNSLKLSFSPQLVVSNVGADPDTLIGLLQSIGKQSTAAASQLINGIVTDGYLPSPATQANSWIQLFQQVHSTYDAKAPFDGNVLYGEAVAYTFVQAMFAAGRNPTRASLQAAINAGLPQGPMLAPFGYSATDHFGVTGAAIGIITNGVIVEQGSPLVTDTTATGPITAYTGTEQTAPASGIPSP